MDELVPEGYYDAVAVKTMDDVGVEAFARLAVANSGTNQVVADFQLINLAPGINPPRWPLRWYGYFTDGTTDRTIEALRAMGFRGDDFMELETQKLNQIVRVKVEHNDYNGKITARIAFVNAPGGGVVKLNNPMDADDKRRFAAVMKGNLRSIPDRDGARTTSEQQQLAAPDRPAAPPRNRGGAKSTSGAYNPDVPPGDDDIPF